MNDLFGNTMPARPAIDVDQPFKADKGHFDGSCNRRACQRSIGGNSWFNRWTSAYYCQPCAFKINDADDGTMGDPPCRRVDAPVTIVTRDPNDENGCGNG